jgi:hypothetical protein
LKSGANQRRVIFSFRFFSSTSVPAPRYQVVPYYTIPYHPVPYHTIPSVALHCTQQPTRLIHINTITHNHTDSMDNVRLACTRIYTCIKQVKCTTNQLLDTKKISTIHSLHHSTMHSYETQTPLSTNTITLTLCLPATPPSTARPAAACRPSSRHARST